MTAVEWLVFHWMELDSQYYSGEIGRIDYRNKRDAIQVEAKELEKEQIIDACKAGRFNGQANWGYGNDITAEQYYNKTYKKQIGACG